MLDKLLEKLKSITDVKENRGERILNDPVGESHFRDQLVGIWFYHVPTGELVYSEEATSHWDYKNFDVDSKFDMKDGDGAAAAGWCRGRVFQVKGIGYIFIYLDNSLRMRVPGYALADIAQKLRAEASVDIDFVLDDQGYNLL